MNSEILWDQVCEVVEAWHGHDVFDLYRDHSPEMKRIRAGLTALSAAALDDAAHDAIIRALDEASVKPEVLRGMCIEVGLEAFRKALK